MPKITNIPQKPQTAQISFVSYVYFALFFISGISGLIYESIWSQYLKQFLGHAAYSQTLVLVIYMGGMALGSWIAAVWAAKYRNLLFAYAVVEIILGALALIFHNLFIGYLDLSFSTVIPFLNKPLPISLYKWGTASLIILPQSMLLGATFPLMAGGILRRFPGLSGYKTSVIYFVNTFGASIGVLISGFYLVREWGLRGAIISGGLIDLFVGFAILTLCLNDRQSAGVGSDNAESNVNPKVGNDNSISDINIIDNSNSIDDIKNIDNLNSISNVKNIDNISNINDINYIDNSRSIDDTNNIDNITDIDNTADENTCIFTIPDKREYYYPLLFVACLTAAASFIYEIGWIRMLSLVLGSSTHSFELMLSAFILGLALGSFFVRKRIDTTKNAPRFLGIAQVVMGATAIATLFTYGSMFRFMVFTIDALDKTAEGYTMFNVISHLICMAVMLPSTICAGMVVPLIIHMLYKKGYGEAAIGKVYAVNTAGGIIGTVAAVWVLMELVGLKYLIIIGGAIDMGLGLYVLYRFRETRESVTRLIAQPVCLAVLVAAFAFSELDPVLASSGVFRYGTISKAKKVVEHKDGKTASITLFKSGDNLVLSTNGKPDASVGTGEEFSTDEYTMSLLGVLPLSVREETRTAAVIGMGAGMTAHYMLYDQMIERLDIVEIEPSMVKLAQKIGPKVENTFNDPRSHIYIEDAKTFFSAQNRTYDVIVSEPSNPWVSGVSSLFSKEFFNHIRRHLNEGGILVQWFHKYEADITILVSILKALGESFPVYDMYAAGSDLIIIAAKDAGTDISLKRDVFVNAALAESMKKMGFAGIDDFKLIRYAGKEFIEPFIDTYDTPANSDYHSFVDLYAVKYRFLGKRVDELDAIQNFIIPVKKIVFADTGYVSLTPRQTIPDLYNLLDIQKAKTLSQQLSLSAQDDSGNGVDESASASVFILDYANARPHKTSFAQIQSAIIQVLQKTLPYLSADEMREVWEVIEKKTAGRAYSEEEMEWMSYFKAVCNYDIRETRRLSLSLLPTDSISDHYSNQMLIASLLASSAVLGDTSKTGRVWERYNEKKDPPAAIRAAKALMLK